MSGGYYGRDGRAITWEEWAAAHVPRDRVRVGRTDVAEGVYVSTVWLGLDHGYGDGPPLIFETMIFGGEHGEDCWRYSTEADAQAGHERVVAALRAGEDPNGAET